MRNWKVTGISLQICFCFILESVVPLWALAPQSPFAQEEQIVLIEEKKEFWQALDDFVKGLDWENLDIGQINIALGDGEPFLNVGSIQEFVGQGQVLKQRQVHKNKKPIRISGAKALWNGEIGEQYEASLKQRDFLLNRLQFRTENPLNEDLRRNIQKLSQSYDFLSDLQKNPDSHNFLSITGSIRLKNIQTLWALAMLEQQIKVQAPEVPAAPEPAKSVSQEAPEVLTMEEKDHLGKLFSLHPTVQDHLIKKTEDAVALLDENNKNDGNIIDVRALNELRIQPRDGADVRLSEYMDKLTLLGIDPPEFKDIFRDREHVGAHTDQSILSLYERWSTIHSKIRPFQLRGAGPLPFIWNLENEDQLSSQNIQEFFNLLREKVHETFKSIAHKHVPADDLPVMLDSLSAGVSHSSKNNFDSDLEQLFLWMFILDHLQIESKGVATQIPNAIRVPLLEGKPWNDISRSQLDDALKPFETSLFYGGIGAYAWRHTGWTFTHIVRKVFEHLPADFTNLSPKDRYQLIYFVAQNYHSASPEHRATKAYWEQAIQTALTRIEEEKQKGPGSFLPDFHNLSLNPLSYGDKTSLNAAQFKQDLARLNQQDSLSKEDFNKIVTEAKQYIQFGFNPYDIEEDLGQLFIKYARDVSTWKASAIKLENLAPYPSVYRLALKLLDAYYGVRQNIPPEYQFYYDSCQKYLPTDFRRADNWFETLFELGDHWTVVQLLNNQRDLQTEEQLRKVLSRWQDLPDMLRSALARDLGAWADSWRQKLANELDDDFVRPLSFWDGNVLSEWSDAVNHEALNFKELTFDIPNYEKAKAERPKPETYRKHIRKRLALKTQEGKEFLVLDPKGLWIQGNKVSSRVRRGSRSSRGGEGDSLTRNDLYVHGQTLQSLYVEIYRELIRNFKDKDFPLSWAYPQNKVTPAQFNDWKKEFYKKDLRNLFEQGRDVPILSSKDHNVACVLALSKAIFDLAEGKDFAQELAYPSQEDPKPRPFPSGFVEQGSLLSEEGMDGYQVFRTQQDSNALLSAMFANGITAAGGLSLSEGEAQKMRQSISAWLSSWTSLEDFAKDASEELTKPLGDFLVSVLNEPQRVIPYLMGTASDGLIKTAREYHQEIVSWLKSTETEDDNFYENFDFAYSLLPEDIHTRYEKALKSVWGFLEDAGDFDQWKESARWERRDLLEPILKNAAEQDESTVFFSGELSSNLKAVGFYEKNVKFIYGAEDLWVLYRGLLEEFGRPFSKSEIPLLAYWSNTSIELGEQEGREIEKIDVKPQERAKIVSREHPITYLDEMGHSWHSSPREKVGVMYYAGSYPIYRRMESLLPSEEPVQPKLVRSVLYDFDYYENPEIFKDIENLEEAEILKGLLTMLVADLKNQQDNLNNNWKQDYNLMKSIVWNAMDFESMVSSEQTLEVLRRFQQDLEPVLGLNANPQFTDLDQELRLFSMHFILQEVIRVADSAQHNKSTVQEIEGLNAIALKTAALSNYQGSIAFQVSDNNKEELKEVWKLLREGTSEQVSWLYAQLKGQSPSLDDLYNAFRLKFLQDDYHNLKMPHPLILDRNMPFSLEMPGQGKPLNSYSEVQRFALGLKEEIKAVFDRLDSQDDWTSLPHKQIVLLLQAKSLLDLVQRKRSLSFGSPKFASARFANRDAKPLRSMKSFNDRTIELLVLDGSLREIAVGGQSIGTLWDGLKMPTKSPLTDTLDFVLEPSSAKLQFGGSEDEAHKLLRLKHEFMEIKRDLKANWSRIRKALALKQDSAQEKLIFNKFLKIEQFFAQFDIPLEQEYQNQLKELLEGFSGQQGDKQALQQFPYWSQITNLAGVFPNQALDVSVDLLKDILSFLVREGILSEEHPQYGRRLFSEQAIQEKWLFPVLADVLAMAQLKRNLLRGQNPNATVSTKSYADMFEEAFNRRYPAARRLPAEDTLDLVASGAHMDQSQVLNGHTVWSTKGDGNCFFHSAFADGVDSSGRLMAKDAQKMREAVVAWMRNWKHWGELPEGIVKEELQSRLKDILRDPVGNKVFDSSSAGAVELASLHSLKDKKQRLFGLLKQEFDRLGANFAQVYKDTAWDRNPEILNFVLKDSDFYEAFEKHEKVLRDYDQKFNKYSAKYLNSEQLWNAYQEQFTESSYYISTEEAALIAHLSNTNIVVYSVGGEPMPYFVDASQRENLLNKGDDKIVLDIGAWNSNTDPQSHVAVLHNGTNHYSRAQVIADKVIYEDGDQTAIDQDSLQDLGRSFQAFLNNRVGHVHVQQQGNASKLSLPTERQRDALILFDQADENPWLYIDDQGQWKSMGQRFSELYREGKVSSVYLKSSFRKGYSEENSRTQKITFTNDQLSKKRKVKDLYRDMEKTMKPPKSYEWSLEGQFDLQSTLWKGHSVSRESLREYLSELRDAVNGWYQTLSEQRLPEQWILNKLNSWSNQRAEGVEFMTNLESLFSYKFVLDRLPLDPVAQQKGLPAFRKSMQVFNPQQNALPALPQKIDLQGLWRKQESLVPVDLKGDFVYLQTFWLLISGKVDNWFKAPEALSDIFHPQGLREERFFRQVLPALFFRYLSINKNSSTGRTRRGQTSVPDVTANLQIAWNEVLKEVQIQNQSLESLRMRGHLLRTFSQSKNLQGLDLREETLQVSYEDGKLYYWHGSQRAEVTWNEQGGNIVFQGFPEISSGVSVKDTRKDEPLSFAMQNVFNRLAQVDTSQDRQAFKDQIYAIGQHVDDLKNIPQPELHFLMPELIAGKVLRHKQRWLKARSDARGAASMSRRSTNSSSSTDKTNLKQWESFWQESRVAKPRTKRKGDGREQAKSSRVLIEDLQSYFEKSARKAWLEYALEDKSEQEMHEAIALSKPVVYTVRQQLANDLATQLGLSEDQKIGLFEVRELTGDEKQTMTKDDGKEFPTGAGTPRYLLEFEVVQERKRLSVSYVLTDSSQLLLKGPQGKSYKESISSGFGTPVVANIRKLAQTPVTDEQWLGLDSLVTSRWAEAWRSDSGDLKAAYQLTDGLKLTSEPSGAKISLITGLVGGNSPLKVVSDAGASSFEQWIQKNLIDPLGGKGFLQVFYDPGHFDSSWFATPGTPANFELEIQNAMKEDLTFESLYQSWLQSKNLQGKPITLAFAPSDHEKTQGFENVTQDHINAYLQELKGQVQGVFEQYKELAVQTKVGYQVSNQNADAAGNKATNLELLFAYHYFLQNAQFEGADATAASFPQTSGSLGTATPTASQPDTEEWSSVYIPLPNYENPEEYSVRYFRKTNPELSFVPTYPGQLEATDSDRGFLIVPVKRDGNCAQHALFGDYYETKAREQVLTFTGAQELRLKIAKWLQDNYNNLPEESELKQELKTVLPVVLDPPTKLDTPQDQEIAWNLWVNNTRNSEYYYYLHEFRIFASLFNISIDIVVGDQVEQIRGDEEFKQTLKKHPFKFDGLDVDGQHFVLNFQADTESKSGIGHYERIVPKGQSGVMVRALRPQRQGFYRAQKPYWYKKQQYDTVKNKLNALDVQNIEFEAKKATMLEFWPGTWPDNLRRAQDDGLVSNILGGMKRFIQGHPEFTAEFQKFQAPWRLFLNMLVHSAGRSDNRSELEKQTAQILRENRLIELWTLRQYLLEYSPVNYTRENLTVDWHSLQLIYKGNIVAIQKDRDDYQLRLSNDETMEVTQKGFNKTRPLSPQFEHFWAHLNLLSSADPQLANGAMHYLISLLKPIGEDALHPDQASPFVMTPEELDAAQHLLALTYFAHMGKTVDQAPAFLEDIYKQGSPRQQGVENYTPSTQNPAINYSDLTSRTNPLSFDELLAFLRKETDLEASKSLRVLVHGQGADRILQIDANLDQSEAEQNIMRIVQKSLMLQGIHDSEVTLSGTAVTVPLNKHNRNHLLLKAYLGESLNSASHEGQREADGLEESLLEDRQGGPKKPQGKDGFDSDEDDDDALFGGSASFMLPNRSKLKQLQKELRYGSLNPQEGVESFDSFEAFAQAKFGAEQALALVKQFESLNLLSTRQGQAVQVKVVPNNNLIVSNNGQDTLFVDLEPLSEGLLSMEDYAKMFMVDLFQINQAAVYRQTFPQKQAEELLIDLERDGLLFALGQLDAKQKKAFADSLDRYLSESELEADFSQDDWPRFFWQIPTIIRELAAHPERFSLEGPGQFQAYLSGLEGTNPSLASRIGETFKTLTSA